MNLSNMEIMIAINIINLEMPFDIWWRNYIKAK